MTIRKVSDGGGCAKMGARNRLLNRTGRVVPGGISPKKVNGDWSRESRMTGVPNWSCARVRSQAARMAPSMPTRSALASVQMQTCLPPPLATDLGNVRVAVGPLAVVVVDERGHPRVHHQRRVLFLFENNTRRWGYTGTHARGHTTLDLYARRRSVSPRSLPLSAPSFPRPCSFQLSPTTLPAA